MCVLIYSWCYIQRKLPNEGWSDIRIQLILRELALMDSNNFPGKFQATDSKFIRV